MIVLTGALRARRGADFTGYRIGVDYLRDQDGQPLPALATTGVDGGGRWRLELEFAPVEEVTVTARTSSGVIVGVKAVSEFREPIVLRVEDPPDPVVIDPADQDLNTGTVTGRVLTPDGAGAPTGMPVVLWGKHTDVAAIPVLVAATAVGGYFAGERPSGTFAEAWGTVAGSDPIPVPLSNGRLPEVVLLVLTAAPPPKPAHDDDDDCECHQDHPPRTPDQHELTGNPEAFSTDLVGGCVNLTMPNRTLEEIVFHAVVRTTEPEIRGATLSATQALPEDLAGRLAQLAAVSGDPTMRTRGGRQMLRLDADLVADRLGDGQPASHLSAAALTTLHEHTAVKNLHELVGALITWRAPGRVTLDDHHAVDWDDDHTAYQATTIAIGHLLTLKQVWRADGYSLGDLLYSLPLAPGQKKQIAIVDWERKEEAIRSSRRDVTEELSADLAHDRDVNDIVDTALSEHSRGRSTAKVSAIGGGLGAHIGPVVIGGAGGSSTASSTAHSHNWRDVSASALNQARDRVQQSASAMRGQRSTTIQTTTQGESLRAQTEVVANYNHCHAMSMEYFEVLRHLKVSTELADVRECLFVPFGMTAFTPSKALRWSEPLRRHLSRRDLSGGFAALERIRTNWVDADFPAGRFADEPLSYLDGALTMTFSLPRPADDSNDAYVAANWAAWAWLMPNADTQKIFNNYLGNALPASRDGIWNERLAPIAAARLTDDLQLRLDLHDGTTAAVPCDATLVSRFRQDAILELSLTLDLSAISVWRSKIKSVTIAFGNAVPHTAKVVARSGSLHYRTDHLAHHLFLDYRVDHELSTGKNATIAVHLDRLEKRNPRKEDTLLGARLVAHLNERVEFYHQSIWRAMHPNRRYLLLDGVIAPNAGGRSVASVVENRVIGIIGNCLVLPVVPGNFLDPNYRTAAERKTTLKDLYAVESPPPFRVSVPTKGVFAEAVLGACNSCERKRDLDKRFWRWEESPIPEHPSSIAAVGTGSRRGAQTSLRPDDFADPIVRYQQVPGSPDPTGLGAALSLIGTPNVFRDLTGLDLNQQSAAAAFSKALQTAQFFGSAAGNLAQQRFANREMDRNLARVQQAVGDGLITPEQGSELTQRFIRSGTGRGASGKPAPSATPAMQKAITRASESQSGTVTVSRPSGSVEVSTGNNGPIDIDVTPPVIPVKQPTGNVCWAAAGAMLMSWKRKQALTIQSAADAAGVPWREKLDADRSLGLAELKSYTRAVGMTGESAMCYLPRGVARLLAAHGPLWVIGDDAIAGDAVAHVRVVTGMHGDGTAEATTVNLVDPADGTARSEPFLAFAAHLEAADPVTLNLGIYHF